MTLTDPHKAALRASRDRRCADRRQAAQWLSRRDNSSSDLLRSLGATDADLAELDGDLPVSETAKEAVRRFNARGGAAMIFPHGHTNAVTSHNRRPFWVRLRAWIWKHRR